MPNGTNFDPNRHTDGELRRDAGAYIVRTWTAFHGWSLNMWTIEAEDGTESPEIFKTVEEAQIAIDKYLAEFQEERDSGEREPDSGDFEGDLRIFELDAE